MLIDYEEFEYRDDETGKKEKMHLPFLTLTLSKRGFSLFPIKCLLDSGVESIIFPVQFAKHFKIDYKKSPRVETGVAGGGTAPLYRVPFENHGITFFTLDVPIRERVFFSEGQQYPLLGHEFFKYFRIAFDTANHCFEIDPI